MEKATSSSWALYERDLWIHTYMHALIDWISFRFRFAFPPKQQRQR